MKILFVIFIIFAVMPLYAGVYLPEPAKEIKAVICDGKPHEDVLQARVLQGIINKKQPQIFLCGSEFKIGSVDLEALKRQILTEYGERKIEIIKPEGTVFDYLFDICSPKCLYLYSKKANLADTFNIAAMLAGRNGGAAVDDVTLARLRKKGCDLPVVDICEYCGFSQKDNTVTVNKWIAENMVSGSRKDMVFCIMPVGRAGGRDFVPTCYDLPVALDGLIYSVYPKYQASLNVQSEILKQFPDNIPVIGWAGWQVEMKYVESLNKNGKYCACIDWNYENGSVWAGFPEFSSEPVNRKIVKQTPEKDKIYIAFMMSDGDAWHYNMKELLLYWNNESRGKVKMCWTVPSLFAKFNPLMLKYLYSTKTDKDEFVQGPSGVGYIYPSIYPKNALPDFMKQTKSALNQVGINMINYWDISSNYNAMTGDDEAVKDIFAENTGIDALLLGHCSHEGKIRVHNNVPLIDEWGNFNLAGTKNAEDIIKAIDTAEEKGLRFVLLNTEAWGEGISSAAKAMEILKSKGDKYKIVSVTELAGLILGAE